MVPSQIKEDTLPPFAERDSASDGVSTHPGVSEPIERFVSGKKQHGPPCGEETVGVAAERERGHRSSVRGPDRIGGILQCDAVST